MPCCLLATGPFENGLRPLAEKTAQAIKCECGIAVAVEMGPESNVVSAPILAPPPKGRYAVVSQA